MRQSAHRFPDSRFCALVLRAALLLALTVGLLPGCVPDGVAGDRETEGSTALSQQDAEGTGGRSDLRFRTEEKLQDHFDKHGWETGSRTAQEYLANANAVVDDPESLHKIQREDGDDIYFLEDTGEFVVVSPAGYIRTYYITDRDYFDRQ